MRNRNARRDNWLLFCIFALISFLLFFFSFADSENQNQGFDNPPHKLGAYCLYAERKKMTYPTCSMRVSTASPTGLNSRVNCLSDRYDAHFFVLEKRALTWHKITDGTTDFVAYFQ